MLEEIINLAELKSFSSPIVRISAYCPVVVSIPVVISFSFDAHWSDQLSQAAQIYERHDARAAINITFAQCDRSAGHTSDTIGNVTRFHECC
ncbi:hypothetical protein [Synechococcus lacustris]|uniref:hypothetical protein n=1 Tax=Synechococcus lacustris TaxID=2116544 RepID=UPI0020CDB766|nr:hypothetical protein [Synechococcus lacustris]